MQYKMLHSRFVSCFATFSQQMVSHINEAPFRKSENWILLFSFHFNIHFFWNRGKRKRWMKLKSLPARKYSNGGRSLLKKQKIERKATYKMKTRRLLPQERQRNYPLFPSCHLDKRRTMVVVVTFSFPNRKGKAVTGNAITSILSSTKGEKKQSDQRTGKTLLQWTDTVFLSWTSPSLFTSKNISASS